MKGKHIEISSNVESPSGLETATTDNTIRKNDIKVNKQKVADEYECYRAENYYGLPTCPFELSRQEKR